MKKALHLMLALALFVCGFNVNAQRNANHNVMTSVEKQDAKKETRAPEVRVMDVKGAAITIIDSKYHFPYDISDNKQHVAIQAFGESESYYWSESTGMIYINGTVFAVSDDGIVSGYYTNEQGVSVAGLWYSDVKEWQFLGMNPDYPEFFLDMDNPDYNGAWAMSNDGLNVGVMQFTADWETSTYIWNPNDGYTQLPNGTSTQTRPNGISSDGSVVVGHGTDEIGYWTVCYWKDGQIYTIDNIYGEAMNASPSGRYICGYVDGMEGNAFVYDIAGQELTQIANTLEVGSSLSATCVTDNGDAFGYMAGGFPPMPDMRRAFAYVGGEVMYFNDYLLANGVGEAESWTIYSINNVTADGRTFIGAANIDGQDCSFIITLEESLCDGPTDLTYSIPENDYDNVVLNWIAPADPVDVTYEIYTGYSATEPIYAGITETSFEIEDLEPGTYTFLVRANWGGECLSNGSNTVKPTIYPCAAENMCELTFTMIDEYGDGWNNAYIQIVGTLSDMVYKVELKQGGSIEEPVVLVLPLCHDTYTFTWVKGEWDAEIGFSIALEGEEIYKVDIAGITDTFELNFLNYEVNCAADVNEITAEDNIDIMPNPASNYFNIEGENIVNVEIYNAVGQVVDIINVNGNNAQINTENYNNGIYFVRVLTSDANVTVKKVVVSK